MRAGGGRMVFGEHGPASRAMTLLVFGVFVVTQRQMVGIRRRVEALARKAAETVSPAILSASVEATELLQLA